MTTAQIPQHNHTATSEANSVAPAGNSNDATGTYWADDAGVSSATYHGGPANSNMAADAVETTIGNTGGSASHANVQPFLCVNYIIALQGVFPSRN